MGAIAQAAGDYGHPGRPRADEARNQVGCRATGRAVVQANIGGATGIGNIGNQRDDMFALINQFFNGIAHQRVLDGHTDNAVSAFGLLFQACGKQFRIKAFHVFDFAFDVVRRPAVLRVGDGVTQHVDKTVSAFGKHK